MVSVTPQPLFTHGKDPVPILQEAGLAPGPVWADVENLSPPPGFDPRTVQLVASRYTDYDTRPTLSNVGGLRTTCKKVLVRRGLTDVMISLAK